LNDKSYKEGNENEQSADIMEKKKKKRVSKLLISEIRLGKMRKSARRAGIYI